MDSDPGPADSTSAGRSVGGDWDPLALSLLSDRTLRFPRVPQVAADVSVFNMPDGLGVQFRGAEAPVIIRGHAASSALEHLLPMLDGRHSLESILATDPPAPLDQALVAKTLSLMYAKGLIVRGTERGQAQTDGHGHGSREDRQRLFWGRLVDVTRSSSTAGEVERRLRASSLIVIGTGLFGASTCDILDRSGFSSIRFYDWDDDGRAADAVSPFVLTAEHHSTRSVDTVVHGIESNIGETDLIVTATRGAPYELYSRVNRIAIQHRIPWLRGSFDGVDYEIGPYVHPFGSPCWTCMRLRRSSALEAALEEEMYQRSLEVDAVAGTNPPIGESVPSTAAAAGLLAAEAARAIGGLAPPALMGQVLTLSALNGGMHTDSFLRVAQCPDCYRGELSGVLSLSAAESEA